MNVFVHQWRPHQFHVFSDVEKTDLRQASNKLNIDSGIAKALPQICMDFQLTWGDGTKVKGMLNEDNAYGISVKVSLNIYQAISLVAPSRLVTAVSQLGHPRLGMNTFSYGWGVSGCHIWGNELLLLLLLLLFSKVMNHGSSGVHLSETKISLSLLSYCRGSALIFRWQELKRWHSSLALWFIYSYHSCMVHSPAYGALLWQTYANIGFLYHLNHMVKMDQNGSKSPDFWGANSTTKNVTPTCTPCAASTSASRLNFSAGPKIWISPAGISGYYDYTLMVYIYIMYCI